MICSKQSKELGKFNFPKGYSKYRGVIWDKNMIKELLNIHVKLRKHIKDKPPSKVNKILDTSYS